ncbi:pseudouridylate synthase, partial [Pantoea dispersa]
IGHTSHGDGRHNRIFRMQGVHRMLLHAERLAFPHPDAKYKDDTAPLDAEFVRAFGLFGWDPAPWQVDAMSAGKLQA